MESLKAEHELTGNRISKYLTEMLERLPNTEKEYVYPSIAHDQLFEATYNHKGRKPVNRAIGTKLSSVLCARIQHLESITALLGPPTKLLRIVRQETS